MTKSCQGPRATVKRPRIRAPAGACDCHFHIFGPYDRFPLSPGRGYTPPEALIPRYRAVLDTLGIERMVIVQPSPYGSDNACTLDAMAALGRERCRGIAVIDEGTSDGALAAMSAAGVRGVRFNAVTPNGAPLDELAAAARRIAPLGWHIQIYAHGEVLPELAPVLSALPVPVVIDHMGQVMTEKGLGDPGFQTLLRLLGTGHCWVKLCGYRSSNAGYPYADVQPFAQALIAAAPERCVWGTDWPHPSIEGHMPDDGELFDLLLDWAPDPATRHRILVDNPAALYGFPLR